MASPDERQEPVTHEFDDDIHEVPSHTPDFRTELAEELARLVPEAVADGRIDVEKLLELLDEDAAHDGRERFGLMWPGKSRALKAAQAPTAATLVPDRENSKDWDTTKNLFIEGDNLEVLRVMRKHYHGKIKLIYIDPPYNTGNDFIYKDDYREGLKNYLEWTRQVSDEKKRLTSNPEGDGRFHSNWLNLMYPRLKLGRELLADDGLIAISIDDWELANLLNICGEIFGFSNIVNVIPVKSSETSGVKMAHAEKRLPKIKEYVVLCAKNASQIKLNPISKPKDRDDNNSLDNYLKYYGNVIVDPTIPVEEWEIQTVKDHMVSMGLETSPAAIREFKLANAERVVYRTNNQALASMEFDSATAAITSATGLNYVWWEGKQMLFLSDHLSETLCDLWADISTINLNKEAHGVRGFRNGQKPIKLIDRLLALITNPDEGAIVLDFFAGSGTTGQAVFERNLLDKGNRRWILVQLPEPLDPDIRQQREGAEFCDEIGAPRTISSLTRERLSRAGAGVDLGFDGGFRSYKLADTSFVKWRETSSIEQNALEERLAGLRGSADDNATSEMLLTELLLKQGYSLTESISEIEIAGLKVWSVAEGAMLAIMDEHVKPSLEQLRAVVEAGPVRLVILEDVFAGDDQLKTNLVQRAKTHGVELWSA